MSARIFATAALFLAGGGYIWMTLQQPAGHVLEPAAPAQTKVFVTVQPLQAGVLLKDADIREADIPTADVKADSFVADDNTRAEIRGAMVRRYLDVGEKLLRGDILRPRDRGFLAAVLAPGTRAVSIGVDARTGASGLISPGDIVDVILTQEFGRGETPAGRRVVAETALDSVRVIAVDQQIAQGAVPASLGTAASPSRVASTVSLQVTPEQAAKVVVAERLGRLTLAVRSIDGDGAHNPALAPAAHTATTTTPLGRESAPQSVFGSDVSAALSRDEPAASPRLRLIQGDAVNDVVFR